MCNVCACVRTYGPGRGGGSRGESGVEEYTRARRAPPRARVVTKCENHTRSADSRSTAVLTPSRVRFVVGAFRFRFFFSFSRRPIVQSFIVRGVRPSPENPLPLLVRAYVAQVLCLVFYFFSPRCTRNIFDFIRDRYRRRRRRSSGSQRFPRIKRIIRRHVYRNPSDPARSVRPVHRRRVFVRSPSHRKSVPNTFPSNRATRPVVVRVSLFFLSSHFHSTRARFFLSSSEND